MFKATIREEDASESQNEIIIMSNQINKNLIFIFINSFCILNYNKTVMSPLFEYEILRAVLEIILFPWQSFLHFLSY